MYPHNLNDLELYILAADLWSAHTFKVNTINTLSCGHSEGQMTSS